MKYIDSEKLIAEIERLDDKYRTIRVRGNIQQAREADLVVYVLHGLSNFIDRNQQEQPEVDEPEYGPYARQYPKSKVNKKQPEVDLEKFTEKMDAWKARYNHPDNIPIKATMAFTARMFYMYPDIAREWYDSLPKATMD